jgi:hypothetical protein
VNAIGHKVGPPKGRFIQRPTVGHGSLVGSFHPANFDLSARARLLPLANRLLIPAIRERSDYRHSVFVVPVIDV